MIGSDRIIKMLDVRNNELVVEEKGIYSIEKFLISRRLMYWQVYLHRTVLGLSNYFHRLLKGLRNWRKKMWLYLRPRLLNGFFIKT